MCKSEFLFINHKLFKVIRINMQKTTVVDTIRSKLHMGESVEVRHLPKHVKFSVEVVTQAPIPPAIGPALVTRRYTPSSLGLLLAAVVVGNSPSIAVQR